jgi:hypothetical protein
LQVVAYLARLLHEHPLTTHYDVIGLLPRNQTIYSFVGPDDPNNRNALAQIHEQTPGFIFYVAKMKLLEPELSVFLNRNYIYLGHGIWGLSLPLQSLAPVQLKGHSQFFRLSDILGQIDLYGVRPGQEYYLYRTQYGDVAQQHLFQIVDNQFRPLSQKPFLISSSIENPQSKYLQLEGSLAVWHISSLDSIHNYPQALDIQNLFAYDTEF